MKKKKKKPWKCCLSCSVFFLRSCIKKSLHVHNSVRHTHSYSLSYKLVVLCMYMYIESSQCRIKILLNNYLIEFVVLIWQYSTQFSVRCQLKSHKSICLLSAHYTNVFPIRFLFINSESARNHRSRQNIEFISKIVLRFVIRLEYSSLWDDYYFIMCDERHTTHHNIHTPQYFWYFRTILLSDVFVAELVINFWSSYDFHKINCYSLLIFMVSWSFGKWRRSFQLSLH